MIYSMIAPSSAGVIIVSGVETSRLIVTPIRMNETHIKPRTICGMRWNIAIGQLRAYKIVAAMPMNPKNMFNSMNMGGASEQRYPIGMTPRVKNRRLPTMKRKFIAMSVKFISIGNWSLRLQS